MEIQIISDRQNAYFGRREVEFSVITEGPTAPKSEVLKELCKKLNINPDSAVITKVLQSFGISQSKGMLHAYNSKDEMLKHEFKHLFERGKKTEAEQQKTATTAGPSATAKK